MELSLKRTITEKWEVSNCPNCGTEPQLIEWVDNHDPQGRQIVIRCPKCYRQADSETFLVQNPVVPSDENERYRATILAIRDWENLS